MLKKFLAKFGKGAATVDLQFDNQRPYQAGDVVQGEVVIQGGEVEQRINHLAVSLNLTASTKKGRTTREITSIPLSGAQTISPQEERRIPFTYRIPADLPASKGMISYHFDTQLDIDSGVDRSDFDALTVSVPAPVQFIFLALEQLGFQEKADSGKIDKHGQEFSFVPVNGEFAGTVAELELRFSLEAAGVSLWVEVDCRRGFTEVEGQRERFFTLNELESQAALISLLGEFIRETAENIDQFKAAPSFSYASGTQKSSGFSGSNGLAAGLIGGLVLAEIFDEIDDLYEDITGEDDDAGYGEDHDEEGEYAEDDSSSGDDYSSDDYDSGDYGGGDDW